MEYQSVRYYEEWLAGQHGGHKSYEKGNYLYCETCALKFQIGVLPEARSKKGGIKWQSVRCMDAVTKLH